MFIILIRFWLFTYGKGRRNSECPKIIRDNLQKMFGFKIYQEK